MLPGFYQRSESIRGDLLPSQSMAATKITVNNNGSIRIEGDFSMHDAEGKEFGLGGRTIISLCRCGHSANKPFCDGSHKVGGFESTCAARDLPPKV
jgi:CDGSH-type Zn-finger protein